MKKITTFILNCLHIRKVHSSGFVNVDGHKFHFIADKTKIAICRTETEKTIQSVPPIFIIQKRTASTYGTLDINSAELVYEGDH